MKLSILYYLLAINVLALLVYGFDKLCAKRGRWRVPEKTLLWFAAIGGSVGAWLGMQLFRHKTQHAKFRYGVPFILLLQVAAAVALWWYLDN